MAPMPNLSFFGLGAMGGGMAANLVKSGFHVTGYDLYAPLVEKFVGAGGHAAATPAVAAAASDIAVIMVATMYQADSVLFEGDAPALSGLKPSAMIILCSTCPPSYPPALRKHLDAAGRPDIQLLDCPVSGGTLRAADGTLSIFASGPTETQTLAASVLEAMSQNLYHIPGGLSMGQKVKAIHQLLAAVNIISASEAMGLAAAAYLDTAAALEHLSSSSAASFMLGNRGPHMLANDWTPLSALAIIWKDALIVVDASKEIRHPVPLCAAAEQQYCLGNARGLLRDDDAKLVTMYLPADQADAVARLKGSKGAAKAGVTVRTVEDLLAGIHLAAAVEAMALCKAMGVDRAVMADIVAKAAGWSEMFVRHVPGMVAADDWTLAACEGAGGVAAALEEAVAKCAELGFPCQMATTALNAFRLAALEARQ